MLINEIVKVRWESMQTLVFKYFWQVNIYIIFPFSMISEREWQGTKWRCKNRIKDSFHFIESVEVMEGLSLYVFVQSLTIVSVMSDSFVFSNTHNRWPPNISSTGHRRLTANKRGGRWNIDQSESRTGDVSRVASIKGAASQVTRPIPHTPHLIVHKLQAIQCFLYIVYLDYILSTLHT